MNYAQLDGFEADLFVSAFKEARNFYLILGFHRLEVAKEFGFKSCDYKTNH